MPRPNRPREYVAGMTIRIPTYTDWFRRAAEEEGPMPAIREVLDRISITLPDYIDRVPRGDGRWRNDEVYVVRSNDLEYDAPMIARCRLTERPVIMLNNIQREDFNA